MTFQKAANTKKKKTVKAINISIMSHSSTSSSEASLSLVAEASLQADDKTTSCPPAATAAAMALPRVLQPSVQSTLRWSPSTQRRGSSELPSPALQPTQLHQTHAETMPQASMHASPAGKQALYSREDFEANSLFSSRNRAVEMSSFGISVSTTTAAGGCSVSTMPTRWLKSAEVRSLGVGSEHSPQSTSPRNSPSYVFERAVQRQVVHSAVEESAMMCAAQFFAAAFE